VAWQKKGLLLPAPLPVSWAVTHAALPHVQALSDGRLHLYFSSRDSKGRSQIGRAELDLDGIETEVRVADKPILEPGPRGSFDDSGVTTSCLVREGGKYFLYYTGWSLGVTVPFYLFAGCAVSEDGRTFERITSTPLLDRNDVDPYLTASPWVLVEDGRWRMWYVSGTGWDVVDGQARPRYHIKYAESGDGLSWERNGVICLDFQDDAEYAFSRPCVIRDGSLYRMWFSARGEQYRLGYGESEDGVQWDRREESVMGSRDDWDREMQAYPAVFDHRGARYLLYNGNGYGRTGVGWARWIASPA
jgi:predicted GH43/DUF377 family glycosyl hydrolase